MLSVRSQNDKKGTNHHMSDVKLVSELAASVFQILVEPGDRVAESQPVLVLESMKMEIPALAPVAGTIETIPVIPGSLVDEGQTLATIVPD